MGDLETLFLALVANINADEELGKLRSTMARLHRKPGEQIQVALYKLKSYYELLLGISFPQSDSNTATIRADNYSANSAKYFVSSNTGAVINKYIHYKVQKGEPVNVMNVCQVVSQHETTTPTDAIQSVMYLPEVATRLDTQMSTASNVKELVIASSRIESGRGVSPKQSGQQNRPNSPARQNQNSGGSSFRSPGGTNYRSSAGSSYRSPGGNNYRSSAGSSYRSPVGNTYRSSA